MNDTKITTRIKKPLQKLEIKEINVHQKKFVEKYLLDPEEQNVVDALRECQGKHYKRGKKDIAIELASHAQNLEKAKQLLAVLRSSTTGVLFNDIDKSTKSIDEILSLIEKCTF